MYIRIHIYKFVCESAVRTRAPFRKDSAGGGIRPATLGTG